LNAPDYADRVILSRKIKVDGSWRFVPVVTKSKCRLKDRAPIHGQVEVRPEGAYYIEWRERGKPTYS
jgi:integrase/recombinase XerD